jgi:hypothetical protein
MDPYVQHRHLVGALRLRTACGREVPMEEWPLFLDDHKAVTCFPCLDAMHKAVANLSARAFDLGDPAPTLPQPSVTS